ncbi:hypothetical protein QTP86_016411 [Hemibagrus guttatus]|nr:hypothetical protein QTP86_016411 [Hemibagrus guttatus]
MVRSKELSEAFRKKIFEAYESGWDSNMSSILKLVHLLPPSSQGRKRPGKISARQACDRLVKFIKFMEPLFKLLVTTLVSIPCLVLWNHLVLDTVAAFALEKEDFQTVFSEDSPKMSV